MDIKLFIAKSFDNGGSLNEVNFIMLQRLQHFAFAHAPRILRLPLAIVPSSVQRSGVDYTLKSLFREAIVDGDVDFLEGRYLQVQINDLDLCWFITIDNQQFKVLDKLTNDRDADVIFSANGDDLLLVADRKEDPDTLFFQRRLMIQGDTELGLQVKNLIDSVELDQLPSWVNRAISYCALQVVTKNNHKLAR